MSNNRKKAAITRRQNYLNRVEKVIDEYEKRTKFDEDRSDVYIYNKYIKSVFCISLASFRNYLTVNVQLERRKLNKEGNI